MDYNSLVALKNKLVRFKNENTKALHGDVWLCGELTGVMSYIVSIDDIPYSRVELEVEEIKNG